MNADQSRSSDETSRCATSVATDRDRLIAKIGEAFRHVTLTGGRSWVQCELLDTGLSTAHAPHSHRQRERPWQQLVDEPGWQPFPGVGGFAFIDAIGFRYYLPPTMIRFIRGDVSHYYDTHLPSIITGFVPMHGVTVEQDDDARWSVRQLRCIAQFIAFMASDRSSNADDESRAAWQAMLDAGWRRYLDPSAR